MVKSLGRQLPYMNFWPSYPNEDSFAPGLVVDLLMPVSKRRISGVEAIIDTGSAICWVYPRSTSIDIKKDVDKEPDTGNMLIKVVVYGQEYTVECGYYDHPNRGSEQMILGANLLKHWRLTLDGQRREFSIDHLW